MASEPDPGWIPAVPVGGDVPEGVRRFVQAATPGLGRRFYQLGLDGCLYRISSKGIVRNYIASGRVALGWLEVRDVSEVFPRSMRVREGL